jgi:hypothetical protein
MITKRGNFPFFSFVFEAIIIQSTLRKKQLLEMNQTIEHV